MGPGLHQHMGPGLQTSQGSAILNLRSDSRRRILGFEDRSNCPRAVKPKILRFAQDDAVILGAEHRRAGTSNFTRARARDLL